MWTCTCFGAIGGTGGGAVDGGADEWGFVAADSRLSPNRLAVVNAGTSIDSNTWPSMVMVDNVVNIPMVNVCWSSLMVLEECIRRCCTTYSKLVKFANVLLVW